MRRFLIPSLVSLAALGLIALLVFGVAGQGTNTSLDAAIAHGRHPDAPDADVALPVLDARGRQSLRDLRGKVVILNIFASWCQPCQAEAPVLEQTQRQVAGSGATVLGVTYLDNSSDSAHFVRQNHITYPVLRDVNGNFVRAFGTNAVPETFVIDRQGHVAALRRFQLDAKWLQQTLPPILAARS